MLAAALLNAAVCRTNAKVTGMMINDQRSLNAGEGTYSEADYANALESMVSDPSEAIHLAMEIGG
jgi:hypothetical protein